MVIIGNFILLVHPINEGDWYYNRIVNGTNANIEDHPEIVSIQTVSDIRSHICGGSLINGFTVLTAAHCIDRQFVSKLQVCHGEINLKYCGNNSIKVKRLIVHERWMRPLLQYDVGLITLVEPVIIERYAVLMSPNYEINTNDLGTVLGWGSLWVSFFVNNYICRINIILICLFEYNFIYQY